jgi:hypothetical protein
MFAVTVRVIVAFLSLAWAASVIAATGRITDTEGNPIAGATIYAFWYYHPFAIPLFRVDGHEIAEMLCGGSVLLTTDASGSYSADAVTMVKLNTHEAHQFVIANGFYNDWEGPNPEGEDDFTRLLGTLRWDSARKQLDGWSKRLTPFGSASIDARLLFLARSAQRSGRDTLCAERMDTEDYRRLVQYDRAAWKAMKVALCDAYATKRSPRTDVFAYAIRSIYPPIDGREGSLTTRDKLPLQNYEPISQELLGLACQKMTDEFK